MTVIIIDNGSQYTHLIKRNCRDLDFYAEVLNNKTTTFADVENVRKKDKITHVILSGGRVLFMLETTGFVRRSYGWFSTTD